MQVRLHGSLGFYGPERRDRFEVALGRPTPLADALRLVGVPAAEIAVAGRNGEVIRLDDPSITLIDDDRLDLFPPSSGG